MKLDDVKPGLVVRYWPSGSDPNLSFVGMVTSTSPWKLGDDWVVPLFNMEPAYGEWRGTDGVTCVKAASLMALEPAIPIPSPVFNGPFTVGYR